MKRQYQIDRNHERMSYDTWLCTAPGASSCKSNKQPRTSANFFKKKLHRKDRFYWKSSKEKHQEAHSLVTPVVIADFVIKLLLELRMLREILFGCHGAYLFLHNTTIHIKTNTIKESCRRQLLSRKKSECFNIRAASFFLTFISWTSAISFSNLSDSLRDFCSASFNSTTCNFFHEKKKEINKGVKTN